MSESNPKKTPKAGATPVSNFVGPVDQLIREGRLAPPKRTGLLAGLDRFEILKLIGAGGMGLVFLARDSNDQSLVAIKMLKPDLAVNALARRRFLKEARHMQRLNHPSILSVREVTDHPERPYFVLPHVSPGSLAEALQPGQPLPSDRVLPIAVRIASALQLAHSKGIIHRDLKPANILIDEDGNAFLTDFGLARTLFNDSMVDLDRGHCEGTAPYMSPQAAAGEAEDTRGDIYALGALLYEMLTGRPPYDCSTTKETLADICQGPPPPIRDLNSQAPESLVTIAEGAMARNHRDRYANMADVVADLERARRGEPPQGPHDDGQPESLHRKGRFSIRQFGSIFVLLLLVLFVLGFVSPGWFLRGETSELQEVRRIELSGVWDWSRAKLGDWNGDGENDLFLVLDDQLRVISSRGNPIQSTDIDEPRSTPLVLSGIEDIDDDGMDEAFLSWAEGTNLNLAACNQYGWLTKKFELTKPLVEHEEFGTIHGGMGVLEITQPESDGGRRLYATEVISWGERALCGFNFKDQSLLWRIPIAAYPLVIQNGLLDLNNDGSSDLVAGSHAVDNGVTLLDGTDDSHSYLYAVSAEGQPLWRYQGGGISTRTHALVVRDPLRNRHRLYSWTVIVNYRELPEGHIHGQRLVELNPKDGSVLATYDAGAYLWDCLSSDLDQDGQPELIVADQTGFIHMLTLDLTLTRKVRLLSNQFDAVELNLVAATNLISPNQAELVVQAHQLEIITDVNVGNRIDGVNQRGFHDNSILVLNHSLDVVSRHVVGEHWKQTHPFKVAVANMDDDPMQEIVLLTRDVKVFKLAAYD